ncbi:MAG: putative zinc-binding metallopeptidase [Candidatus Aenigmatarchaeota archaeon]|nr:MAG: putative zinc-binding metallopeptidase [Candidatus Aenigmarchaeota archaeon]
MAFERTRASVDRKLEALGLSAKYKMYRLGRGESWCSERRRVLHINQRDADSRMMARQSIDHVVLHELGHVFSYENKAKLGRNAKARRLFGNIYKHYRRNMKPKRNSPDFISTYAQVHPADNFAEVFGVYVHFGGDMKKVGKFLRSGGKSGVVMKQFRWLAGFVKQAG